MASGANAIKNAYKLYVRNIPWTVGSPELRKYFAKFGQVTNSTVIFDKKTGLSRNYGFIVYANKDGFEAAKNTETHKLEGNVLRIQPAGSYNLNNQSEETN